MMEEKNKSDNENRIAEEYLSSLADLNCNSKPLINMLTILAEENIEFAHVIVTVVEQHIAKVSSDIKLPILYLIDSIVKNVKSTYVQLFSHCIVNIFSGVFEKVDEKVREKMYGLRQTWNEVFPQHKLYALDVNINEMDHQWPITAKLKPSIHVNPNFFKGAYNGNTVPTMPVASDVTKALELRKRELELELEFTNKHLEEVKPIIQPTSSDGMQVIPATKTSGIIPLQPHISTETAMLSHINFDPAKTLGVLSLPNENFTHGGAMGKNKTHLVHPKLLNAAQQRDPRLQRRIPQISTLQTIECAPHTSCTDSLSNESKERKFVYDGSTANSNKTIRDIKESNNTRTVRDRKESSNNRKSPERRPYSKSSSAGRSRSGSSRDKERSSKRTESKNVSRTYKGRSGFSSSSKHNKSGGTSNKSLKTECDKDSFEIAPLSTALDDRHVIDESAHSKTKIEPKRISKVVSKVRSRSSSIDAEIGKDTKKPASSSTVEKNLKPLEREMQSNKDVKEVNAATLALAKTKDLEKNISSKLAAPPSNIKINVAHPSEISVKNVLYDKTTKKLDLENSSTAKFNALNRQHDKSEEETEPATKKSRSAELDSLFGTKDIDLRPVLGGPFNQPIPEICDASAATASSFFPNMDDSKQPAKASTSDTQTILATNLKHVRAKLAKAAKISQIGEPSALADLNINEDSQDTNDEGIRTIITQAKEMFDANSINQDQYKNLIQTVMTISESKKLNIARRRESLTKIKEVTDAEKGIIGSKRSLKTDSTRINLLKKRIPKLSQTQVAENSSKSSNDDFVTKSVGGSASTSHDMPQIKPKEKRMKLSKWGDKLDVITPQQSFNKGWGLSTNKIGESKLQPTTIPHPPLPPISNPNLRLPQIPWSIAQKIPASASTYISPAAMICGNVPPPPTPPNVFNSTRNSIDNPQSEMKREITIDGLQKEIRVYDNIAIVFMELDQPREIGFKSGQRTVTIDTVAISLLFNDAYKSITVGNDRYRVRFGFPSRELYIDDHWYEVCFGGPPVPIPINQELHLLQVEGPVPEVNIGRLRRDLVAGKINMIVDAKLVIPLFLDATLQVFRLGQNEHTLQFADKLLTVLLDGEPTAVEYGGLPKSFVLRGIKYFIRFASLPTGVVAGEVEIKDMIYVKMNRKIENIESISDEQHLVKNINAIADVAANELNLQDNQENAQTITQNEDSSAVKADAFKLINIDILLQQLLSSGLLKDPTKSGSDADDTESSKQLDSASTVGQEPCRKSIIPINFNTLDSLKNYQPQIVNVLYSGMQCSSCGVRFPPEETIKYSQHLDWHFHQNRRDRDISKKAPTRKWYYELVDWIQYEEMEYNGEDGKKIDYENANDNSNDNSNQATLSPVATCPAGQQEVDRLCDICHEKFEQFWDEDIEEWHLKFAIRVDDKICHPTCYEDYKKSINKKKANYDDKECLENDETEMKIQNDGDAASNDTAQNDYEDDDVILLPNEEPSITEIVDDDEYEPDSEHLSANNIKKVTPDFNSDNANTPNEANESDVEIQEPVIPYTDLDTYEEKELPEHQPVVSKFLNVKIKEEPKDEEEDDGFEEVGPCIPDDEITINSISDGGATSVLGDCNNDFSETLPHCIEDAKTTAAALSTGCSNDKSSNLEADDENNTGITCATTSAPFATLVNKIKINITKNILPTYSSGNVFREPSESNINHDSNENSNTTIPIVSTIPVLCAGGTMTSTFALDTQNKSSSNTNCGNVSTISVIGSYGSFPTLSRQNVQSTQAVPLEPTITFEFKPALKKTVLKRAPKVECGTETSGLCSIM